MRKETSEERGSSSGAGGGASPNLEWRFNQTLRNVQGLLKGRSMPGKVMLSRKSEPLNQGTPPEASSTYFNRSFSDNDRDEDEPNDSSFEGDGWVVVPKQIGMGKLHNSKSAKSMGDANNSNNASPESSTSFSVDAQRLVAGARATDSARVTKFTQELSRPAIILEKLRELSWSGIPPYMRPNIWRLLLGYAPPNSDRREAVLTRKRLEYVDCVSQYYDIPDIERTDEEINMLRQIAVDCPRTVPDVTFFQHAEVQKSLERILYTWAIRHPASGYVQGINDLVTPFLIVFLSEHLEGGMENWSVTNLSPQILSNIEADCYWCLSKFLDGMQDHYTFAQPGIQRLVFRLKELVRRIDEPVSKHIEDQGLEFLQFAFRWFNCLMIREIPFHLVTRLWDTYLSEGDSLPEFLVYISASFLLTWSDELQKLDFQEMVMFLQHLPTKNWTHHELEMVLSRAYMWHTMFNSSPSHLAG